MPMRILKKKAVDALRAAVPSRLADYKSAPAFPAPAPGDTFVTGIQVPDAVPQLEDDGPSADAENAERVYRYLKVLTERQASDQRLWVTLTHGPFWKYTQKRWPDAEKESYVLEHWFVVGAGLRDLRRNALARLWWAAHLTCAPWEQGREFEVFKKADRFFYTKVLLRSQQAYWDVIEREFGSSLVLRICFLDALHSSSSRVGSFDDLVEESSKRLRLVLLHRKLESAPVEEVLRQCRMVTDAAAELQASSASRARTAPGT